MDKINIATQFAALMDKLLALEKKYGFFSIIKSLFILSVIVLMTLLFINPTAVMDRIERIRQQEHQQRLEQRMQVEPRIRMLLDNLRLSTGGERASLLEFHNGSKNLSNVPFLYADMRYESTDSIDVAWQYQNVSLSHYPAASLLFQRGYWYGSTGELKAIDKRLAYGAEMNGVHYIAFMLLEDTDTPLGVLIISFKEEAIPADRLEQIGTNIRRAGAKLCSLLN